MQIISRSVWTPTRSTEMQTHMCVAAGRAPFPSMATTSTSVAHEDLAPLNNFHEIAVLSREQCASIISAAEAHNGGNWEHRGEYLGHTTTDIDVTTVESLDWVSECVTDRILTRFSEFYHAIDAQLDTLRVVKYVGGSSCAGLPLHSDGTPLSFVCPLNDFNHGGTYVRVLQRVVSPPAGRALLFCGRWMHAGAPVREGTVRYVLTGFVHATFLPAISDRLERLIINEQHASAASRICPSQRRWLRRVFAAADVAAADVRACTRCGALVPLEAVRHCCEAPGCCGIRWCDTCLQAASADIHAMDDGGPPDIECSFIADMTLADGALVKPGATIRKVWRLGMSGSDWDLGASSRWPRLVRSDNDADESIGSRCLGDATFVHVRGAVRADGDLNAASGDEEESIVDASVEIVAPSRPGAYRVFFRLLSASNRHAVAGTDELFVDFFVGVRSDDESYVAWRANQLMQRRRIGPAIARSWEDETGIGVRPPPGCTLVLAFAGADARIPGAVPGGVPAHEFVKALRGARADAAIFIRDAGRSWYLRGVGESGHDFNSVCESLRAEIEAIRPRRLVTLGCSMGGYAALRAAIALGADAAVAFAPQVIIDPHVRRCLQLPRMGFDDLLEALAAVASDEGIVLASLVESIRTPGVMKATHLEVHVGDRCPGDVTEARLLETACTESGGGVSCACVVHADRDHCLAAAMKQSGELHDVLARLVSQPACNRHDARMPEAFAGFVDCDDF